MVKEIKLLKNNDNKDWSDTEWVQEFYEFLQGDIPEGIHLSKGHKPKMSDKKAMAIIWYLQEHFSILPDHIEQCHNCRNLFDSYSEGIYWETKGRHYCDSCQHLVPENYDKGKKRDWLSEDYYIGKFDPKHHTIRAGHRFKEGDYFSPRIWSGKPYNSKQIVIAPDIEVEKVWDIKIDYGCIWINEHLFGYYTSTDALNELAKNDGLAPGNVDLLNWLGDSFKGQIICWNKNINY